MTPYWLWFAMGARFLGSLAYEGWSPWTPFCQASTGPKIARQVIGMRLPISVPR